MYKICTTSFTVYEEPDIDKYYEFFKKGNYRCDIEYSKSPTAWCVSISYDVAIADQIATKLLDLFLLYLEKDSEPIHQDEDHYDDLPF